MVEVVLTGGRPCDMCSCERDGDHWEWLCPCCGAYMDTYQQPTPVEETCRCGCTSVITTQAHERWARHETDQDQWRWPGPSLGVKE